MAFLAAGSTDSSGGSNGALFTQTGTVDWGQLGARTVSFSVDVLSRVSAAKVDPYTLEVGRVVSSQFELSKSGTNNMKKALSELRCNGSLGNALWFGFGVRHLVRVLPSTDEGLTCLALCSTLSEYYPHDVCAEIIHEIVKSFNVPPHGTPSILQWEALIGACAGSLARSGFGPLVDRMIDLSPFQWSGMLSQTGEADHDDMVVVHRGWCTPKSIAAALRGVGSISRGEIKAMTVMGGNDAGWFAAVCVWLFDVRVLICTATGDQLFSNCGRSAPQVKIIYEQWQSSQTQGASSLQTDSQELICIGRTFVLAAATDVIQRRSAVSRPSVSGRSSWEHILSATFGHEFEQLMKNHHLALALAIGSAARIFQGIVNSEEEIPKDVVDGWDVYVTGAFGRGFVQGLLEWFPELAPLRQHAEKAAKKPLMQAITSYQESLSWCQSNCKCQCCSEGISSMRANWFEICYPSLVETILRLGIFLSEIEVDDGLLPKRASVMGFYRKQAHARSGLYGQGSPSPFTDTLGPFAHVFYHPRNDNALSQALQLFAGTGSAYGSDVAISESGICVYSSILTELSDDIDVVGKTCVIPGTIEFHGKPYGRISDPEDRKTSFEDTVLQSLHLCKQLALNVSETVLGLDAWFEPLSEGDKEAQFPKGAILPHRFIERLTQLRPSVHCSHRGCPQIAIIPDNDMATVEVLGTVVQLIQGSTLARCLAVALAVGRGQRCIVMVNECVQCCIRAGLDCSDAYDADPDRPDLKNGLMVVMPRSK